VTFSLTSWLRRGVLRLSGVKPAGA